MSLRQFRCKSVFLCSLQPISEEALWMHWMSTKHHHHLHFHFPPRTAVHFGDPRWSNTRHFSESLGIFRPLTTKRQCPPSDRALVFVRLYWSRETFWLHYWLQNFIMLKTWQIWRQSMLRTHGYKDRQIHDRHRCIWWQVMTTLMFLESCSTLKEMICWMQEKSRAGRDGKPANLLPSMSPGELPESPSLCYWSTKGKLPA